MNTNSRQGQILESIARKRAQVPRVDNQGKPLLSHEPQRHYEYDERGLLVRTWSEPPVTAEEAGHA